MKESKTFENQKMCYINRYDSTMNYTHLLQGPTYEMLDNFTKGEFQVYFYLCSQVPHTVNGKQYDKNKRLAPYGISPEAMLQVYPNTDRKTLQRGIDKLIEDGFLTQLENNLYTFDNVPIEYRGQTVEEHEQLKEITAEQAYAKVQQKNYLKLQRDEKQK